MPVSSQIADQVVRQCLEAASANQHTPGRGGSLVSLDAAHCEELMVTADLHGNRLNFRRLCEEANLDAHPGRHLVMQEVCHGGPWYPSGAGCMSHLLLEDVVRMKLRYPERFHFLLSNHELAEWTDYPISKNRQLLNLAFRGGIREMYGEAADVIRRAYADFLATCPLAIRLPWGAFVSHSLPERTDLEGFDVGVLQRSLVAADVQPRGPAFQLVWGRDYRDSNAAAFARLVDATLLIHGHEPCLNGYAAPNPYQIILDCCSSRACYLSLPGDRPLGQAEALRRIVFLDQRVPGSESPSL